MAKDIKQASNRNPFIVFNPPMVDPRVVQDANISKKLSSPNPGDGPIVPSGAAETLGRVTSSGARKFIREEDSKEMIKQRLLKRQKAWFYRIDDSHELRGFCEKLEEFIDFAASYLNLNSVPEIILREKINGTSFAVWTPEKIEIAIKERHPMDIFRSVAHELTHQKQHENDELHSESGQTGSDQENEANALAGIIMRHFAKANPSFFELDSLVLAEGLFGSSFGGKPPPKQKKSKPNQLDVIQAKVAAEREKHKNRLELIAARAKVRSTPRAKAAAASNDDEDAEYVPSNSVIKHFHNPSREPALANYYDRQATKGERMAQAHADFDKHYKAFQKSPMAAKGDPGKNAKFPLSKKRTKAGVTLKIKEHMCLLDKSLKTQIPYSVLLEVYKRGYESYKGGDKTPQNVAFSRVDSFIAGGLARKLDKDLEEQWLS